jgi:hypothetical protein
MTYLIRAGIRSRGRNSVVVADEIRVVHPVIYRDTGERIGGLFARVEATGRRNKRQLEIVVWKGTTGTGSETGRGRARTEAPATATDLKRSIRSLRPREAEEIACLDTEISDMLAQLAALRTQRDKVVRRAFSNGHVVRLTDLQHLAASTAPSPQPGKE